MEKIPISMLTLISLLILSTPLMADDCKKAVELYNKGTISQNLNKKERLFKEALTLPCKNREIQAKIHNNLADTYENAGRFEEAVAEYKKAIDLDPALTTPYISLGDVYSKMGKLKSASQYYNKYWELTSFKTRDQLRSSLSLRRPTRAIRPVPSETLYFGFNQAVLTEESKRQLEELLPALNDDELRSYRFQVIGNTCSIGSDEYNQWLSEKRSEAVKKWQEDHGYPSAQLQTVGFGEEKPIADNSTEEGRRLNRRVEIRTVGLTITEVRRSPQGDKGLKLLEQGYNAFTEGRYQESAALYEKAWEMFKEDNFRDGIRAALGNLYLVYQALGNSGQAQDYLKAFQEME